MGWVVLIVIVGSLGLLACGYAVFSVIRFTVKVFLSDPTVTFEFASRFEAPENYDDFLEETHRFRAIAGAELVGMLVRARG
ncbi:MAG: hypothetical protein HY815_20430, partial [Candidatus Riflebacteria bacterium]|nr:hypothetical protein [Candidatus Riflebacteria bacterium]